MKRAEQHLGHYHLLRLLGHGSFADVYLGEHIHLKSVAAIKMLSTHLLKEQRENFLHEARVLAQLSHPHIIRILDFGIEEDIPYLVMDYASEGSLSQRHPRNTMLPIKTVVEYVQQIGDGLQYAHDKKLIHRDLKPENILLAQNGDLLLADFGVALIAQNTRSQDAKADFAGTALYMAPEQLQGKPEFASDQYALGIMTYEWLSGTCPFHGTLVELYSQHSLVPPPPLREHVPSLSQEVEQVVLRALAKDPRQRFASVKDFARALEQAYQASRTT
ncbi:MAG: serine/threonine protein kinase, partial [Ktedonobacteraceae bacterium]|nr:serine/threonine protein kinase [Ktedonobacteraceae bacterium]